MEVKKGIEIMNTKTKDELQVQINGMKKDISRLSDNSKIKSSILTTCRSMSMQLSDVHLYGTEDILEIVDKLFHELASDYRSYAKEMAEKLMSDPGHKSEINQHPECPECGESLQLYCNGCNWSELNPNNPAY